MDQVDFHALIRSRPFGSEDATRAQLQFCRTLSLSTTLWGKTADDLRHQLLAHFPQIPSGFKLADFRELLRITEQISAAMKPQAPHLAFESETIAFGNQRYTEWEARCEIIRRAIAYMENR